MSVLKASHPLSIGKVEGLVLKHKSGLLTCLLNTLQPLLSSIYKDQNPSLQCP